MKKKLSYNRDRESHWLTAMLNAYYTVGVMVSFNQPEPSDYEKRYLALRRTEPGEMVITPHIINDWQEFTTDNLREAQGFIHGAARWYIHDFDTATFTSEEYDVWTDKGEFNARRMREWKQFGEKIEDALE